MADFLADLIEALFSGGIPSPDQREPQRRLRLAVSVLSLAGTAGVYLRYGASGLRGWPVLLLVVMSVAAAWVVAFSFVDLVKSLPSFAWVSMAAAVIAAVSLALTIGLTMG
jgi:hypothetical protein